MQTEGSLESTAASTKWEYHCILCDRIFNTIQALSGHQNKHRNDPRKRKPTHECVPPKRPTPREGGGVGLALNAMPSEGGGGGLDLNSMPSEGGGGGEELDLELKL